MVIQNEAGTADALLSPRGESEPIHRGLIFSIVGLALLMMSIDTTIVATALHTLRVGLDTSIYWAGWTITAYSLGFVVFLPITGKLSEQYGCRKVFLVSVAAFTLASLCCGLADNIYALIALRALQAAGGAGFTPSATEIIVNYFGNARDRAVSLFGSIFSIGAMIGPIFGGLFVSYWTWRGIFLVNVPIGIAVIVLALRFIPRDPVRTRDQRPKMDITGMALLGGGLLAGMLAISYLAEGDARSWSPAIAIPMALAIGLLWMFFRHINNAAQPFVTPRLISGPGFGAINLINGLYGGVTAAAIALVPLFAWNRYGIDALHAGTLLIAQGGAAILFSIAGALTLRRTGYRLPLYFGGIIIAAGMLLLGVSPVAGIPPYVWLAGSALLVGIGRGANNPASRNAGLQLAPEYSSTLAALRTLSMQIGTIITISVDTAILASSNDPGHTQAWLFALGAALLFVALPLITRVPEHRGSW
ncbi:MAG TPA: MFS transporter [Xanthobacteraceae bacterium]|jgi:MFS family permease|nr:MFS transporter [Xanthobacteraceae bacterium]